MKQILMITFFCLVVAVSAAAQSTQRKAEGKAAGAASDAMPTVDQVLEKYLQAIGGKAAVEKVTSRLSKGTFEIPAMNLSGSVETYQKAPNRMVTITNLPGFGVIEVGFNGTVGWAKDPATGLRELSGAELAAMKRDSALHRQIKELYPKVELKGKEKVGEREAYLVVATPAEGNPDKYYFDRQTGLLIRLDVERETPQGKIPAEVYLEDYREVDGIKMPFTSRHTTPVFSFVTKLSEVKHNLPIDDAKFNKPAAQ